MTAPERVGLGTWPTPLEPAPRLAAALGLGADDLWVKRDDLTGLGGGGNKVRKLEWICAAALAAGARTLVTSGAPQSNHARLTAAAGARLGLDVVLVLAGRPADGADGAVGAVGNLALDGLLGATVVWAGDPPPASVGVSAQEHLAAAVRDTAWQLDELGRAPVVVPFGGSSVVGARGYLDGGRELAEQAGERGLDLATVVTALGSGGTMAGLVAALGAERVLGVHVGAVGDPMRVVAELVAGLTGAEPAPAALRVRLDQVGAGYAVLTDPVLAALMLAARTEGLVLDPIYTGRALAGLVAAVEAGDVRPGRHTVLLHTGGLPGLFGHPATLARVAIGLQPFVGLEADPNYHSGDWLPRTGRDQSCALCGSADARWVHPLDRSRVTYRVYGKGHTLPGYWTLCDPCEQTYAAGDDAALLEVMKAADHWSWTTPEDVEQQVRQPLAVFRAADRGARPLAPPT